MRGLQNYQFRENKKLMLTVFMCIFVCFAIKIMIYAFQMKYPEKGTINISMRQSGFCSEEHSFIIFFSGLTALLNNF